MAKKPKTPRRVQGALKAAPATHGPAGAQKTPHRAVDAATGASAALAIVQSPKPRRRPAPAREEAEQRTANIKQRAQALLRDWWELGLEVRRAVDDRVPEALGVSAHAWLIDCFGESWQKIYRALRIVRALAGVEPKQLALLNEGNAYQLAQLPQKARTSEEWLKRAAEMKLEDFRAAILEELRTKYKVNREPMLLIAAVLGFSTIPETLKITIKEAMDRAAAAEEVDLETKAGKIDAIEAIFANYLEQVQWEEPNEAKR